MAFLLPLLLIVLQSCNSPFQPEQVYSPKLVLYGIAFEGDSTLVVRVDVNSKTPVSDTTAAEPITGLGGDAGQRYERSKHNTDRWIRE